MSRFRGYNPKIKFLSKIVTIICSKQKKSSFLFFRIYPIFVDSIKGKKNFEKIHFLCRKRNGTISIIKITFENCAQSSVYQGFFHRNVLWIVFCIFTAHKKITLFSVFLIANIIYVLSHQQTTLLALEKVIQKITDLW